MPSRHISSYLYPLDLGCRAVAANAGASMTPPPGADSDSTGAQGTNWSNHPADQFSEDQGDLLGSSLHLTGSGTVAWNYADGTSGSWTLY